MKKKNQGRDCFVVPLLVFKKSYWLPFCLCILVSFFFLFSNNYCQHSSLKFLSFPFGSLLIHCLSLFQASENLSVKDLGEDIVGRKIKVWWPDDKM